MPARKIKIAIIDDHQIITDGLCFAFQNSKQIDVDGVYSDGQKFLKDFQRKQVDIVLTDIDMPEMNGLDIIRNVKSIKPNQKIIVLSMHEEANMINKAFDEKINGYLLKDEGVQSIHQAVEAVYNGGSYYSNKVLAVLEAYESHTGPDGKKENKLKQNKLSPREIEILKLISQQKTGKEIAGKLFLSIHTVYTHRKNIMRKLGASHTAGLVKYYVQNFS